MKQMNEVIEVKTKEDLEKIPKEDRERLEKELKQKEMEKEAAMSFIYSSLRHKFGSQILQIKQSGKSIDVLKGEIKEKKCKLTKSTRDLIQNLKTDALEELLK